MKIAGFFQELWPPVFGTPVGSIRRFLAPTPCGDESGIVECRRSGHEIIGLMGVAVDVLDPEQGFLSGDSLLTGGEWLWRADLWRYVHLHHVLPPDEFLNKIKVHDYVVPEVEQSRLLEVLDFVEARC
ncbi:hypothetical protein AB0G54_35970 [Streptomyces yokosukanensis]|uniref:hypothetical protein n=1 Tax=Streptomyces yokosukanensis TaxID=67386 RepID=UPI00344732A6